MATIFTRIIDGDIPGHFLWRDPQCVAFLSINPLQPGHALVVPITEVDHWTDLSPETSSHLMTVAHHIGRAQRAEFEAPRVGLMIAGFEVPHAHVHVVPMYGIRDLDFDNAATTVDHAEMATIATTLRARLTAAGFTESVPTD